MENTLNKNRIILKSPLFWKIYGGLILVLFISIGFVTFALLSGFNDLLSQAKTAPDMAADYRNFQIENTLIVVLLFSLFVIACFFIARFFTLRIIWTLLRLKGLNQGDFKPKLEISSGDEFEELSLEISNLAIKLQEERKKEEFINKIKSDFITIAAHQLRTPLSIIKWAFYTMKSGDTGPLNDMQTDYVNKGAITSDRMINLINDLLNVSRIEKGEFNYIFENIDLREVLTEATDNIKPKCDEAGIELKVEMDNRELRVDHDPKKIRLALDNLLSNAVKYTPANGRIEIAAHSQQDLLEVAIRDSGMGIPPEERPKVFQSFFRGSQAMKMDTEASGLGLYITKSIIEKHGGRIWFDSESGQGTTFYFNLPIKDAENSQKSFKELVSEV